METGGPSAILGPLERLGQGRTKDGKGRSAKGQRDQDPSQGAVAMSGEKEMDTEQKDSQGNIDIRV